MLWQWDPSNIHGQRIHGEHAPHQRLPHAGNQLHGFGGFQTADHTDHRAQHAGFLAGRNLTGGGHVAEDAAVAGAFAGNDGHHLTGESDHAGMDVRLAGQHAGVIDEEFCGEVVGGIDHQIVRFDEAGDVARVDELVVGINRHIRVERADGCGRGFHFGRSDTCGGMDDLALQIAHIHHIAVHQSDMADAGRRQIQGGRRTKPARSDDEHAGGQQPLLPFDAHALQNQMARVPLHLFISQCHVLSMFPAPLSPLRGQLPSERGANKSVSANTP